MSNTVFHKIILGEIPATKVYEDERVLVIEDINPKAPIHLLVIPKEKDIVSIKEIEEADKDLLGYMMLTAKNIASDKHLEGYKLIFNVGKQGGQEVPYLHMHLLGGWNSGDNPAQIHT